MELGKKKNEPHFQEGDALNFMRKVMEDFPCLMDFPSHFSGDI